MADKPCRWVRFYRKGPSECMHPLFEHLRVELGIDAKCHGCPCHEPQQATGKQSLLVGCPNCGGPADNGFDRCVPPNPYWCTKCNGPDPTPPGGKTGHDKP